LSAPEPSDEELLAFAESLLQSVEERLRERRVLEEAIHLNRATWLTLYEAANDLKRIGRADPPQAT
jgi:predicted DNA-binding protein (MmcQ/YjbR family)